MSRAVLSRPANHFPPELVGAAQVATPPGWLAQPQSGKVVAVNDPDGTGRVQVELLALNPAGDTRIWARVATPFAGDNYGLFALPGIGEEVMVMFLGGDPAFPVVVGALWNGGTALPENQPNSDTDIWSINGRAGSRMAIDESSSGGETIAFETPAGVKVELTDGGSKIQLTNGSMIIRMEGETIAIESAGSVNIKTSSVRIDAPQLQCTAALATFDGTISCQTLAATSVISSSYTPGAGNIW